MKKVEIDWAVTVFQYDPVLHEIQLANWIPSITPVIMPLPPPLPPQANSPLPIAFTFPQTERSAERGWSDEDLENIRPYVQAAIKKLIDSANAYMAIEDLLSSEKQMERNAHKEKR